MKRKQRNTGNKQAVFRTDTFGEETSRVLTIHRDTSPAPRCYKCTQCEVLGSWWSATLLSRPTTAGSGVASLPEPLGECAQRAL